MSAGVTRVLIVTGTCLVWLGGCETSSKLSDLWRAGETGQQQAASPADAEATGSVAGPNGAPGELAAPSLLGSDPQDDLSLGKKHFRAANYGLAEKHFRRAVELHPRDGEAWVGLAASYDRLRRFDLADRAYDQALKIMGPSVEILNNQGFSYMLRGDYRRARLKFDEALARDPANPHAQANLKLLHETFRKGKSID
jgi:Flp pilus assembly protein TadD